MSSALNIVAQLYTNLFIHNICDIHSNAPSDKLIKTNCYSTYYDLISGKGNKPITFKNFAKQISKAMVTAKSGVALFTDLRTIKKGVEESIYGLKRNVDVAQAQSGSVRAEFRVKITELSSVAPALDSIFSGCNLKNWTLALGAEKVNKLAKFYIDLLAKPIKSNLLGIMGSVQNNSINQKILMESIASISLMESLLTATLFSGYNYSFASELVWNRSSQERESMELMKWVRSHNRPVFSRNFFRNDEFIVTGDGELLDSIFGKIVGSKAFRFPPVQQLVEFSIPKLSAQDKANILWKMYFEELNPHAFLDNGIPRWKFAAVNTNVITGYIGNYAFIGAVGAIFNFDYFNLHGSWKRKYYMIQAERWLKDRNGDMKRMSLECLLMQSIRDLGIEHFHYAGGQAYNDCPSRHMRIDGNDRTTRELASDIPQLAITHDDIRIAVRNKDREFKAWEKCDLLVLLQAVNKHGLRSWIDILSDPDIIWKHKRKPNNISAKWNQLKNCQKLYKDPRGKWAIRGLLLDSPITSPEAIPEIPDMSNDFEPPSASNSIFSLALPQASNSHPISTHPSRSSNESPSHPQGHVRGKSIRATSGLVRPLVYFNSPSNVHRSPLISNLQEEESEEEENISSDDEPRDDIGAFLSEKGSSEHDSIFSVFKSKKSKLYFILN